MTKENLPSFFLKLVIADKASVVVDTVFDNCPAYSGVYLWFASILYSIQLYADFLAWGWFNIFIRKIHFVHICNAAAYTVFEAVCMKQLKKYIIIGIIFVLITGTLAHFFYEWTGNNYVTGLFTPVNESVWEHMKLLFFPMLIYLFVVFFKLRSDNPCIISAFCFGILLGTFLIPVFFYAYTSILGRNIFALDVGTFVLSTLIAFYSVYKLTLSCKLKAYTLLLCTLAAVLFICFLVFSYHPPELPIFVNLEKA